METLHLTGTHSVVELNSDSGAERPISTGHVSMPVEALPAAECGPLRIALVSSSSGSRGGGEFYLCGLAEGLRALGHELVFVLAEHERMDELAALLVRFGEVRRIRYCNTYDRPLRCVGAMMARSDVRRLSAELAALRADVLHINKQNLEDGLDLLLAAQRSGSPTVATVHVTRSMHKLGSVGGFLRDWVAG